MKVLFYSAHWSLLRSFVLLVKITCTWRSVWRIDGMILKWKTEILEAKLSQCHLTKNRTLTSLGSKRGVPRQKTTRPSSYRDVITSVSVIRSSESVLYRAMSLLLRDPYKIQKFTPCAKQKFWMLNLVVNTVSVSNIWIKEYKVSPDFRSTHDNSYCRLGLPRKMAQAVMQLACMREVLDSSIDMGHRLNWRHRVSDGLRSQQVHLETAL